jgi:hypothetical protein
MNQMELERQHLLSMLWDAGFCDFHLLDESAIEDTSINVTPKAETRNIPREFSECSKVSVIDLVGEDSESHISNKRKRSVDSPYQGWKDQKSDDSSDPYLLMAAAIPVENLGDVANIDPHELSFEIQGRIENEPSSVASDRRVFKPEEWKMIDWGALEVEKLKECMLHFGLKPSGGKGSMISNLKRIFQYLEESPENDGPDLLSTDPGLSREEMFVEFSRLIHDNAELYEKMILFESVDLGAVHRFLESRRDKVRWRTFSLNVVRDYLENAGVQYSNTTGNGGMNEESHRRKKRRQLRKSISCP